MPPRGRDLYRLTQLAGRYLNGPLGQQVKQVQNAIERRGDPSAQLERKRRKLERKRVWSSRWAAAWAVIATIFLIVAVAGFLGVIEEDDGGSGVDTGIGAAAVVIITGTLAIRSTRRMILMKRAVREFDRQHKPTVTAASVLPPKGSEARAPLKKLADAEDALERVLGQLSVDATVPAESVEQAQATGAEAAAALRGVARQLTAVELAREHAPEDDQGALLEGVQMLRKRLDQGLEGYRGLVAAAGRVVAASSTGGPSRDLSDATDHLAGLAVALRELSADD